VGHTHGVDSEVGRLRTVLAHRPGAELLRITPRTKDRLCYPGLSRPMPFLESVAQAMGVEALTVISTGVDPPASSQQQWDDGGNALAVDRRVMLCYERNVETNTRLEAAGVEVIRIPGSELGARGGPRALSCPVSRDSVAAAAAGTPALTLVAGDGGASEETVAALDIAPVGSRAG